MAAFRGKPFGKRGSSSCSSSSSSVAAGNRRRRGKHCKRRILPLLLLLSLFYFSQVDRKSGSKNIPNPPFPPLQLCSSFFRKKSRNSDKNGVLHTLSPAKMSIFLPVFESFVFFVCQGVTCPSYFFFLVAVSLHPEKKKSHFAAAPSCVAGARHKEIEGGRSSLLYGKVVAFASRIRFYHRANKNSCLGANLWP